MCEWSSGLAEAEQVLAWGSPGFPLHPALLSAPKPGEGVSTATNQVFLMYF